MLDKLISFITDAAMHIDFYGLILPLLVYTILIAVYGIFIWGFYKSVSKRDLFHMEIKDHSRQWRVKTAYVLKYLILFPLFTFVWFAVLTVVLFFLSKSQSVQNILIISMAMVAAARISAYYKRELSEDISKIMPLAVLGIFVVDPTFFSLSLTISRFYEVATLVVLLANYLIFTIVLEFVMRLALAIRHRFGNMNKMNKNIEMPKKHDKKTVKKLIKKT